MNIKSFPEYKHLLQENYVEYKHIFFPKCNSTQEVFLQHISTLQHVLFCIPRSFLVIHVCYQGKNLCSPCISQPNLCGICGRESGIGTRFSGTT